MGITDKLGHAAEELKEKGQEAVRKVTHKEDAPKGDIAKGTDRRDPDLTGAVPDEGEHWTTPPAHIPAPATLKNQDASGRAIPE